MVGAVGVCAGCEECSLMTDKRAKEFYEAMERIRCEK